MKEQLVDIVIVFIFSGLMLSGVSCRNKEEQTGRADDVTSPAQKANLPTETIMLAGKEFIVELAFTRPVRRQGLMYRRELADNAGMLFVFEKSQPRSFHMQNCLIDLDILFIQADGTIVQVTTMRAPPPGEMTKYYNCAAPSKYALELAAGTAEKMKITAGMKIDLPRRVRGIIPEPD